LTARTLRGTFRATIHEEGLSERERVAQGLSEMLAYQARTIEDLARKETTIRGPRPRSDALQELEVHAHWADFSDPAFEAKRAMPFIERGLSRGAKVVALLPSVDIEDFREAVAGSGHDEDHDRGQLATVEIDGHLDVLKTAGVLAVVLLAVQGIIQASRTEGYPEVWFITKVASELLAASPQRADLALRVEWAFDTLARTFPISVYCPYPERFPGDSKMTSVLFQGHRWSAVGDLALAVGPNPP